MKNKITNIMEKNTKITCWIIILLILALIPLSYFFLIEPAQAKIEMQKNEISLQEEKISTAVETIKKAKIKTEELVKKEKEDKKKLDMCSKSLNNVNREMDELLLEKTSSITTQSWSCVECVCENQEPQIINNWWFQEKIELEIANFAYNKKLWIKWAPYVLGSSIPKLSEFYKKETKTNLKSVIEKNCWVEFYKESQYSKKEKDIAYSYVRAFCKDEKIENCSAEIKSKIETLKSSEISNSNWVQLITKYLDWNPWNFTERLLAYYDDFWKKICIIREKTNWLKITYSAL